VTRQARLAVTLYAVAACAYVADRISKLLVEQHLAGRPPITVIPHVVDLSYTTNSGGAFSLFPNHPWIFFAASAVVCIAIVIGAWRVTSLPVAIGLGLILGGALGNLTDRVLHGTGVSGGVVDFIDFHIWPVFNVADSCVVIGVIIVVASGFFQRAEAPAAPPATPATP
jgi:signal peptidase II